MQGKRAVTSLAVHEVEKTNAISIDLLIAFRRKLQRDKFDIIKSSQDNTPVNVINSMR